MSDNTRFLTLHAAEAAPKFCGRNAEIPQSVRSDKNAIIDALYRFFEAQLVAKKMKNSNRRTATTAW